ncbi:MAG: hypothetical protein JWM86_1093 [Thermoleophilia bacterium]|nr:hypothetical protein [Thermoleophilia bacterium]
MFIHRRTAATVALLATVMAIVSVAPAQAATAPVSLGTAAAYGVLAGSTVTNSRPTVVTGELGLHPGTDVTGFPPGTVNGAQHIADAPALQAKSDLTTAYLDAAGRPLTATVAPDIGGLTLVPGVYRTGSVPTLHLTGNVTLDAQGDPNAVFIFQIESALVSATDSSVTMLNGAQSCNVFWQVGSSATLGTRTTFRGNVLALTSIAVQDSATIDGRLLARNGAVTLLNDTITRPTCADGTGGGGGGGGAGGGEGGGAGGGTGVGPDRTGPIALISRLPRAVCTTRNFVASVALRDNAGISRAHVFLDGRFVSSTRLTRTSLSIRIRGLRIGRHVITVVAYDRAGNRSSTSRAFRRCQIAVAAPTYTG